MKINYMNSTIELTKSEMKAAETYGSEMYKQLREARIDNPTFSIKVVSTKKSGDTHKGLTQKAMKKFIEDHESDEAKKAEMLGEFYKLCGLTEDGKKKDEFGCAVSYGELKQWFFTQFPQFDDMSKAVNTIMDKVREQVESKKSA